MAHLPITVNIVYGSAKINLFDLINLKSGDMLELDQYFDEPLEICVNGKVVAKGELEHRKEGLGIRITTVHSKAKRLSCLNN
ncbi:FliM/FliN family flagellar motor switch protein [Legionella beliardensis]|nr:FliM/FliN family flagellar motor switch protein [Legionella beliardensis]